MQAAPRESIVILLQLLLELRHAAAERINALPSSASATRRRVVRQHCDQSTAAQMSMNAKRVAFMLLQLVVCADSLARNYRPPPGASKRPSAAGTRRPPPSDKKPWKPRLLDAEPAPTPPHVLHRDADVVVVDKPPGWSVEACATFAEARVGTAQLLDVDCSGVLCLASSDAGAALLRDAAPSYLALCDSEEARAAAARGLCAIVDTTTTGTLVRLTGRNVREALAAAGAPARGDAKYGCGVDRAAPRALVHCERVTVGKQTFEAPRPPELEMTGVARRAQLREDQSTTCYRELFGAADGVSANLCVDRYGPHLLVQRPEDVSVKERDAALALIDAAHAPSTESSVYEIVTRVDRSGGGQPLPILIRGPGILHPFEVKEHGTSFRVELGEEKLSTGLFLDQRPQRHWLRKHGKNLTILNLFAHAGAYSAAAAAGGAARTVSVDCDKGWLAYLEPSLQANGVENAHLPVGRVHDTIYGDCFEWLKRLAKRGESYDIVILDPPSFSTVNKKRWSAAKDYGALVQLAAPLVAPNGALFCTTNARKLLPRKFARTCGLALKDFAVSSQTVADVVLERVVPPAVDYPTLSGCSAEVKNLVFRFVAE